MRTYIYASRYLLNNNNTILLPKTWQFVRDCRVFTIFEYNLDDFI